MGARRQAVHRTSRGSTPRSCPGATPRARARCSAIPPWPGPIVRWPQAGATRSTAARSRGRSSTLSQQNGGFFALDDFARHRSEWVEPISTTYRGVAVYELPPNGQGLAALQMLNILEGFDLRVAGPRLGGVLAPAGRGEEARVRGSRALLRRPRVRQDPGRRRCSRRSTRASGATLIDPARAARRVEAGDPQLDHGDTTYLAVADRDGNMVSLIQSNYTGLRLGLRRRATTGFGLHNRGAQFSLDPASPNASRRASGRSTRSSPRSPRATASPGWRSA